MQNRRSFVSGLLACPLCAAAARAEVAAHWSYEGADGAEKWGAIDPTYRACAVGGEQSPINLEGAVSASVERPRIAWPPEVYAIVNNGHTIQANAQLGGRLTLGKETYELKQFHFHTPSEHALNGARLAMEAHFVHAQPGGRLAVIGVFLVPGAANAAFAQLMKNAPATAGEAKLTAPLDAARLLPNNRALYRYEGSLTTPPCAEVVDWNVFATPVPVAQADIDAFKKIFPMNARPLQPVNRRFLLKG